MRQRVGEWHLSKKALVRNYRLVFNHYSKKQRSYMANIVETGKSEDTVHGVVYHITAEQLKKLETHEGAPAVETRVELDDGNEISHAKTFIWKTTDPEHEPPRAYQETLQDGLLQHGYERSLAEAIFGRFGKQ
jgi:gamma-glutamylcyclotransferase (GGCT)/AIG2-like uncharacterized protein YtfP